MVDDPQSRRRQIVAHPCEVKPVTRGHVIHTSSPCSCLPFKTSQLGPFAAQNASADRLVASHLHWVQRRPAMSGSPGKPQIICGGGPRRLCWRRANKKIHRATRLIPACVKRSSTGPRLRKQSVAADQARKGRLGLMAPTRGAPATACPRDPRRPDWITPVLSLDVVQALLDYLRRRSMAGSRKGAFAGGRMKPRPARC
jgi:hypothetical protein